jgi:glycosyltransferase involved in cell wall biosynthesis
VKKNIVFLSHTFMGGPFVVGSHHLAKELAKQGHKVLHISTPLTLMHLLKKDEITSIKKNRYNKLVYYNENLGDYLPGSLGLPWALSKYFYKFFRINLLTIGAKNRINKIIAKFFLGEEVDYLIIDQPTMQGLEAIIPTKKIVYRATDIYKDMFGDNIVNLLERKIVEQAVALVGTSKPVCDYLKGYTDKKPMLLLENGVDIDHFAVKYDKPVEFNELKQPVAIYVGALDKRFDCKAINILAEEFQFVTFVLIGPANEEVIKGISKRKNVVLLGSRKYEDIPKYLQNSQLALLPMSNHKSNVGRSPMKLYEYLASGIPVLCTYSPEIKRRNLKHVLLYKEYDSMKEQFDLLLKTNYCKKEIYKESQDLSWEGRAKKLVTFLEEI